MVSRMSGDMWRWEQAPPDFLFRLAVVIMQARKKWGCDKARPYNASMLSLQWQHEVRQLAWQDMVHGCKHIHKTRYKTEESRVKWQVEVWSASGPALRNSKRQPRYRNDEECVCIDFVGRLPVPRESRANLRDLHATPITKKKPQPNNLCLWKHVGCIGIC